MQGEPSIVIDLEDISLQEMSQKELAFRIEGREGVLLRIPLPSINRSNEHIDIVNDYLDASYAIELISQDCPNSSLEKKWENKYFPCYLLTIQNPQAEPLSTAILDLIWAFQYPENETSEANHINIREKVIEYEESITTKQLRFPEIIDDYFANLINGAYYQLEPEEVAALIKSHPERAYGFWVSAYYNNRTPKVYMSTDSWIVPREIAVESILEEFEYGNDLSLLNAELLLSNGRILAISEGIALEIPIAAVLRTLSCAEEVYYSTDGYTLKYEWSSRVFWQELRKNSDQPMPPRANRREESKLTCYVSEYSDFVVLEAGGARSVIFDVCALKKQEILEIAASSQYLVESIQDEIQSPPDISLPWSKLNDEIFEQLCYDIIYQNSRFDRHTIRKMGKSRSRDGGRDIVVSTKPRPGERSTKYIFQCKFYNSNGSANTSNVTSISDVIDQYGADGYGLMCSCYIDSTLYDKLDGIGKNRSIAIETWSKFEIERYIARRPTLRARFFS